MSNDRPVPRLRAAGVTEHVLPGIGRRFDVAGDAGSRVAVVIHHSGRRDLYVFPDDGDAAVAVSFGDAQARALGSVITGAYFRPAVVEEIDAVVGSLLIDWVTLTPSSPATGRSIAELGIRSRTRMTIAAILRDHVPIVAPGPGEVLRAGDRLVVLGRHEDLSGFVAAVVGTDDG